MYIIKYLLVLVLLLNNALLMNILFKSEERFINNTSNIIPTFKPNSYYLEYDGTVDGRDFNFNKMETNKIIKTNKICMGNDESTCITGEDLDFIYNVPKKNDTEICLANNCITKIDLEHLNKYAKQGIIVAYNGDINKLPYNWKVCDGTKYGSITTPDLRDRFIMGKDRYYNKTPDPLNDGHELINLKPENIPSKYSNQKGNGKSINVVPKYYSIYYIMMTEGIE